MTFIALALSFAVFSLVTTVFVALFGGSTFSDLYPAAIEVESPDENVISMV